MSVTRRGVFAVVALPALLFSGPGRAEKSNDPVKIGLILPLTGPFASSGKQMLLAPIFTSNSTATSWPDGRFNLS